MADDRKFASVKDLKVGRYIIIDDKPCKIVSMDKSKPGKHGAAKVRIVAISLFDGQKKTWLGSSDAEVEVPVIKKKEAQVLAVLGDTAQLMDKETYETFEVEIPEELKGDITEGANVELMEALGYRKIVRVFKS